MYSPVAQEMDYGSTSIQTPLVNDADEGYLFDKLQPYVVEAEALPNDIRIEGSFAQQLEISIKPGEVVSTEPGAFVMSTRGLKPNVDTGSFGQACLRLCCAGESFFRLNFKNDTATVQQVAVSPPGM